MPFYHDLDGVFDDLSAGKGVLHPLVAHGDAVADPNGVELEGNPAGHPYAGLGGLGYLFQVDMAWDELVTGVYDRHKRTIHLLIGKTRCLEKRPVRGPLSADLGHIASHKNDLMGGIRCLILKSSR